VSASKTLSTLIAQQPRYLLLAKALVSDIQVGRYGIGDLLPTEHELCSKFGASRFTVRQALRQLVQLGMVTRQPGVGTRLVSKVASSVYRQTLENVSDIYQYAADTELHILDVRPLVINSPEMQELLQGVPGQEWLHIDSMRLSIAGGGLPICFTEIFLHPAFRSLRGLERKAQDAVYKLIEEQFGERITEVRQQIRAGALPPRLAKLLSAKPRSPCLWITRTYLNARGEVIEVSRNAHPGDRYQYHQTFRQDR
jgi:GntR family transcriptional regulator